MQHRVKRFFPEKDALISGNDPVDDAVLRVANDRGDDFADSDIRGAGRASQDAGFVGPQIESYEDDLRFGGRRRVLA